MLPAAIALVAWEVLSHLDGVLSCSCFSIFSVALAILTLTLLSTTAPKSSCSYITPELMHLLQML